MASPCNIKEFKYHDEHSQCNSEPGISDGDLWGSYSGKPGITPALLNITLPLVSLLNEKKQYPLRLLDAYSRHEVDLTIDRFEAFATNEQQKIAEVIGNANVIGTARRRQKS